MVVRGKNSPEFFPLRRDRSLEIFRVRQRLKRKKCPTFFRSNVFFARSITKQHSMAEGR
jgi:hypothetical protein